MKKDVAEYRKVPYSAFDVDIFHTFKNNQGQFAALALQLSQTQCRTPVGLCLGFCSSFVPVCLLFLVWFGRILFI